FSGCAAKLARAPSPRQDQLRPLTSSHPSREEKIPMTFIRIGLAASMALCTLLAVPVTAQEKEKDKQSTTVWTVPDIGALPDDAHGRLVRRGRDLITMT